MDHKIIKEALREYRTLVTKKISDWEIYLLEAQRGQNLHHQDVAEENLAKLRHKMLAIRNEEARRAAYVPTIAEMQKNPEEVN